MPRLVGANSIKITCLQVLPGHEFEVSQTFQDRFAKLSRETDSSLHQSLGVFKGFGIWDLFLFSESLGYEATLTKLGSVPGILKSIQFLTFPFMTPTRNKNTFKKIIKSRFLGFSLLRMQNAFDHASLVKIEKVLKKHSVVPIVMGTLGINQLVLLTLSDQLEAIANGLHDINFQASSLPENDYRKTQTQFAINHNIIPQASQNQKNSQELAKHLSAKSCDLAKTIDAHLLPGIEITIKPGVDLSCAQFWNERKSYELCTVYGSQDIQVFVKRKLQDSDRPTWAVFLADLLQFRKDYRDDLLSTETIFRKELLCKPVQRHPHLQTQQRITSSSQSAFQKEEICQNVKNEGLYNLLLGVLTEQQATGFLRQIYALQCYSRQPSLGIAFSSLQATLPRFINEILENKPDARYVAYVSRLIGKGVDLRAYGADPSPPRLNASFYRLAGGVQQCISALELFPKIMFKRLHTEKFEGFVVADEPIYGHYDGALLVPIEDFLYPERWWALHHEIAHVVDTRVGVLDTESTAFKSFRNQIYSHYFPGSVDYLREVTAEVLGFASGFFHDLDAFDNLLWNYIFSITPLREKNDHQAIIEYHLQRCYSVHLFHRLACHDISTSPITKEYFSNKDNFTVDYLDYIKKIQNIAQISTSAVGSPRETCRGLRPALLAAMHWRIFKALGPVLIELMDRLNNFKEAYSSNFWSNPRWLDDTTTKKAISHIEAGRIFFGPMNYPEAVLFLLAKKHIEQPLNFAQRIAGVLSFSQEALKLGA